MKIGIKLFKWNRIRISFRRGIDMKKGDMFSTGFGVYKIIEIKDDNIYAIRKDDAYNNLEDFNVLHFTKQEVESYIKYL